MELRGIGLSVWLGLFALAPLAHADEAQKVVVVLVDEKTQRELGPFNASYRGHNAAIVRAARAGGAKGIAFHFSFPENSADGIPLRTEQFARAAAESSANGVPVVVGLGHSRSEDGTEFQITPNDPILARREAIGHGATVPRYELAGVKVAGEHVPVRAPDGSERSFADVKRDVDAAAQPESSGIFGDLGARLRAAWNYGGAEPVLGEAVFVKAPGGHPTLAEELALRAGLLRAGQLEQAGFWEDVRVGMDSDGFEVIQAARHHASPTPPDSVTTVSYVDVLKGRVPPSTFEGALVIVGATGLQGTQFPAQGDGTPGLERVYVQAALLQRVVAIGRGPNTTQAEAAGDTYGGALGTIQQQ